MGRQSPTGKPCTAPGCKRVMLAKELCEMHYQRLKHYGRLERLERPTVCSVPGCGLPVKAKGFCNKHWLRQWRHGDPSVTKLIRGDDAARFWSYVQKGSGCWEWSGTRNAYGYGTTYWANKTRGAHRVSYELHRGPIPDGLTIDHLCRNRACVNPDHLEAVTASENVSRGFGPTALNARKTHCLNGHPLTPDNIYPKQRGRNCKLCGQARARKQRTGVH